MYIDRLGYKKDFLAGFDGRCRLVSCVFLIAAMINTKNITLLAAVIILCIIFLSRELHVTLLRLVPVNLMLAAVWFSVLFGFNKQSAFIYTLRINCASLLYMAFIIPMSISVLAASMSKLRISEKLITLFILTHRYIFLLHERFWTSIKSMNMRKTADTNLYSWKALSAVFSSILVHAAFRSKKIWIAMVSRGFAGTIPVTIPFKWRFRDSIFLSGCAAFSVVVICLI
jgi:cobalt/nickel transport system permease protein